MAARNVLIRHGVASFAGGAASICVVGLGLALGFFVPATQGQAPGAKPEQLQFTVTKDEASPGRPHKIEVTLPHRVLEAELEQAARAIRNASSAEADRTFIGFRVEGQADSYYWASATFDPDYKHTLIGLSADDYQKLLAVDLSGYPDQLGHWLRDGALGHVMVLYKRDGKYFIDSIFPSGGKNTEQYSAKKTGDGLRLEEPDNGFNEYYIVQADGQLQGWGENGLYLTLQPLKPDHRS